MRIHHVSGRWTADCREFSYADGCLRDHDRRRPREDPGRRLLSRAPRRS
ncbi:unnamed protein product [[Actinomadura] parvosata subsp. kistnae]|nr:unnamed protein product [Actinomadura parvosata subsp. kistnae]